jgi:hypothetical protein
VTEPRFTLVVPYYRNMKMLAAQVAEMNDYPKDFNVVIVDDGSLELAEPIVRKHASIDLRARLALYRVGRDIPWNRGGARNLASKVATTKWLIHVDIDHLLPAGCAQAMTEISIDSKYWYRFDRFRRGRADETRRKDAIPPDQEFGKIHPHIDSYLCSSKLYWSTGGYDEDYSGCLGGGTPFLKRLEAKARVKQLPSDVFLVVYTRDVVDDASDNTLSRDTAEFTKRRRFKEMHGKTVPTNPIRFPWTRVL